MVEVFDMRKILTLAQGFAYGEQLFVPDFEPESSKIKSIRYKENSLLLNMITPQNKSSLYIVGINQTEDPSDVANWEKIPWIVVMFGVAIVYNLIFRKSKSAEPTTKTAGYQGRGRPNSYSESYTSDLNKSWKAQKANYKPGNWDRRA
jgi:hypothetical protein